MFIFKTYSILILILVYVDDVIILGSNIYVINNIINTLRSQFALKDLGRLYCFLRIEVKYFNNGLFLSQVKYINDLLAKTHMLDCSSTTTPMAVKAPLKSNDHQPIDATHFRAIVGSL